MREDPEADARAIRLSAEKIEALFSARRYDSEIELLLAAGEACPFSMWRDKETWLRIFYRAVEDAGYYVRRHNA